MKTTSNRYSIVFLLIEGVLKAIKNRLTRSSPIIQPTPMIEACLLVKTNELLMEGLGKAIKNRLTRCFPSPQHA